MIYWIVKESVRTPSYAQPRDPRNLVLSFGGWGIGEYLLFLCLYFILVSFVMWCEVRLGWIGSKNGQKLVANTIRVSCNAWPLHNTYLWWKTNLERKFQSAVYNSFHLDSSLSIQIFIVYEIKERFSFNTFKFFIFTIEEEELEYLHKGPEQTLNMFYIFIVYVNL